MRYQDPPGSQDPAQDPRRRPPTERAPARHRGSHQRPQGRQDQGRSQGQGRSQDQGWSPGQARSQDQGWSQGQGRSQDQGWSPGQGRSQDQGWFEGQGRSDGGSGGTRAPGPERYQDASQAVFLTPRHPDRRRGADQDPPWDSVLTEDAPGGPPTWHDGPGRTGRGLVAGAVTGVLAAAIALGVAMLVSAFVRPQASPVIAVGGQVINLTPTPVKEFAVAHFGTNDKTMLLGGMYAVIALLAMVIGWLARRRLLVGAIGIGAFGALGAFVAVIQPGSRTTDAIPALVGGVAGVVAIISLVNWSAPTAFSPATGWTGDGAGGTGRIDRRKFLVAGTATAAVAAGSAVGGQILTNRRFNANASRAAVKLTAPAKKAPPLARQAEINIPGLSPFYTPNSHFYRVDTALVIPQVTTQQWSLRVHGMVGTELNISFKELLNMPMVERDITLMCVSEPVGGGYIGNARWQGVLLSEVLRRAKLQSGVSMLATTDVNGMTVGVPSQIALDGRDAMLVVGMNGVPLPQEHGFPVRMVVPGLYGYCSATKWITDMEVTTLDAFTPYWVHRGWAKVATVKTESRIDTPKPGSSLQAGKVMVAGVAWAQHKGVEMVEVRIDGGQWTKATVAAVDSIDTWLQWYVPWQATAGQHTLEVRATDKTGYTQTPTAKGVFPDGATGYHTVHVSVA